MGFVLFFLFTTIFLVVIALVSADDKSLERITSSLLALISLLILVFSVAPKELGWGRVPERVEEFTKRLDAGKVYRRIATESVNYENDGEKVLLVSDEELSRHYYAIRVKVSVPIPERFTLINGLPREVK